jgi:RimJ/RimL family protein N-acetyltransferase
MHGLVFQETSNWEHALNNPNCSCHSMFVVTDEENICVGGWCRAFPTNIPRVVELGIGLQCQWRARGLGTQMLQNTIAWARGKMLNYLVLTTHSENKLALDFFRKYGFVETQKNGQWLEMSYKLPNVDIGRKHRAK